MTRLSLWGLTLLAVWSASASLAPAAAPIASIDQRFSSPDVKELPDFQRHITPLLGRLGCNGRACHGSFQGQGGLRLSLFGYDFAADHVALTGGDSPRIDRKKIDESLILAKPTLAVEHDGGKRMDKDSWEYNVLRKWIAEGAPTAPEKGATFDRLEVTPTEFVFTAPGQTIQLQATAYWSDGTSEIVTPLCRFRTNDDATAEVDLSGQVKMLSPGDTHVVVFYENGVAPISVILPVSDKTGDKYPTVPTPTTIDQLVVQKLKKLGMTPSELCTDQEFLRRVSLDLIGTLPTPAEVTAFLSDASPDKRERKIDELLARPEYAAWWATRFCDVLGNSQENAGEKAITAQVTKQWHAWVEKRLAENAPYDEIIEGVVLAVSRGEGQSFVDYCQECTDLARNDDYAAFAAKPTMPHFWARQNVRTPNEKALAFSHAFLGVRLQCAECHKHPFDQWTQQDFESFTAFFTGVQFGFAPDAKDEVKKMEEALGYKTGVNKNKQNTDAIKAGKTPPFKEVWVNQRAVARKKGEDKNAKAGRVITPRLLGGDEVVAKEYPDPRSALMEWMRNSNNPYFAKAIVNRIWANYFGVGIVEPADDMNLANPPSNAALLDDLSKRFIEHNFDLKWLHREIVMSRTYQLSWKTNETNVLDVRNFSHAALRRMPAEIAYDALVQVSMPGSDEAILQPTDKRMIGSASGMLNRGPSGYALETFGKPERETNCDCERSNEPSLLQTVFLRNDNEVTRMLERKGGWVALAGEAPAASAPSRPATKSAKNDKPKLASIGKGSSGGEMEGDSMSAGEMEADKPGSKEAEEVDPLTTAQTNLALAEDRLEKVTASGKKERIEKVTQQVNKLRQQVAALEKQAATAKKAQSGRPAGQRGPTHADRLAIIRDAYLRTLSREPRSEEVAESEKYLIAAASIRDGARDLLWALLNTKEFIVNH